MKSYILKRFLEIIALLFYNLIFIRISRNTNALNKIKSIAG